MIYAKKRLGQHFLKSSRIISKILGAAELKPDDTILEVGPGTGALTFALARRAKRVVAVEKDRDLAAQLKERLNAQGIENVEVITADILKIKTAHLNLIPYTFKLLGNLPYY
ncbi:methyltransferase domain-containing protein, partial [Candidatus Azambacteria bacterium]|nr:methyltransferase domain-containing protein [Candidatus Azambacteria bacterium]